MIKWSIGTVLAAGIKVVGGGVTFFDMMGVGLDNLATRSQIEQGEWIIERASEMAYRHLYCYAANTETCVE